ncbi:hypothetical protein [Clostridium weizhouense]|uniref:Lipoprotein n=1 Tax=Clostridium weizhouense TaxID=2859781 RepID=A0ABS7AR94_9CLOT|nr:hypothetical protein [Clostridium weizhouense]MBW6411079.1 hypothetical protein [Clostridium weizhouense]
MKKIISKIMILITIFILIGCKTNNSSQTEVDVYDSKKAITVANEYLIILQEGDLEKAKELCTDEFFSIQRQSNLGNFKIQSFKVDKTVDSGNKLSIIFDIIRGNDNGSNSSLDKYNVNVIKEGDDYKVNDLKTEEVAEVYSINNQLRMKKSSEGESKLLLKLSDIPKEVYNKESGALEELKVPNKNFSCAALGYNQDKVTYVTTDGKDNFIGILYVKEKDSVATIGSNDADKSQNQDNTNGILEKSQTEKMSNCGVLRNCKIDSVVFNSLEDKLLVSYSENGKGIGLKIFDTESGERSPLNVEDKFPIDKYNIKVMYTSEEEVTIKVTLVEGIGKVRDDESGIYNINIQKATINKKEV